MEIGIDTIAIALMELSALGIFLLALMFRIQQKRISNKLKALVESGLREKSGEDSWSMKWIKKHIIYYRRRILNPGLFLAVLMIIAPFFIGITVASIVSLTLGSVGYTFFIVIVALYMISDSDAYQMYNYVNAIMKVSMNELNAKDAEFMVFAIKVLNSKAFRFFKIAVIFAILGPFVPSAVNLFTYLPDYLSNLPEAPGVYSIIFIVSGFIIILLLSSLRRVIQRIRQHD